MASSSTRRRPFALALGPAALLVLLAASHCSSDASSSSPPLVRLDLARTSASPYLASVAADASNAFAVDLYGQVAPDAASNFLVSPVSAHLALSMAYAGAAGTTASQMAKVLHAPAGSSMFAAENALSQALAGRGASALAQDQMVASGGSQPAPVASDYRLDVVNEVWGETGYSWGNAFLTVLAESYGTGVYSTDFAGNPSAATTAIDQWVSEETSGKVATLMGPGAIDDRTRMVLVNAIHVRLPWAETFSTSATTPMPFTRADGTKVTAPFLNGTFDGGLGYADTSSATLVSLPLYGDQVSVVLALPKKDLPTLRASLTKDSFVTDSTNHPLVLALPKLALATGTFSLEKPLEALGMTDAFDPAKADFTAMCSAKLHLDDVLQSATLDLAEQGVEATAATAVVVSTDGGIDAYGSTVRVTFDRPFLLAVVDASGAILMLGQVGDPTSAR